jgi:hypothetical protein
MKLKGLMMVIACAITISACASPAVFHAGDVKTGFFFDVPRHWSSIDSALLVKAQTGWKNDEAGDAITQSLTWQSAFVGDGSQSVETLFSNEAPKFPVVYASARTLFTEEKSAITSDVLAALQDVVLPVSSATGEDGLFVDKNESIVFDGHRAVRQNLRWTFRDVEQQVRTIILLSEDNSVVYTFIARCSTTCFNTYGREIDQVLSTVTLKEPTGA